MASTGIFDHLKFENLALKELPVDDSMVRGSRKVSNKCHSLVDTTPVENPKLVAFSTEALKLLDIDSSNHDENTINKELSEVFGGNRKLDGSVTAAHCYCGHQFGHFSGQLGDGAAISLGQIVNDDGEKWEMQLKGAGKTPFSRTADGRKVLRSSIREFLCSEGMHHLGIPTTRAGCLVTSNDTKVVRDMFYDGRAKLEDCAVVLRLSPSFLRFGSFEIFKPVDRYTGREGSSVGNLPLLKQMLDFTVKNFYPEIERSFESQEEKYLEFYREVCKRTAVMVSKWQLVGFCHGVLNTDNMSVLGLTIDYGPFGFMDIFDENYICNSSDENGRYTYKKQPEICHWNLVKFAEAIQMAVPIEKTVEILQSTYYKTFEENYLAGMRSKLGLVEKSANDEQLFKDLFTCMQETFCDFTNCFRSLTLLQIPNSTEHENSREKVENVLFQSCAQYDNVLKLIKPKFDVDQLRQFRELARENPRFESMMGQEGGPIYRELEKLDKYTEFQEQTQEDWEIKIREKWTLWLNKYEERLQLDVKNKRASVEALNENKTKLMKNVNPKYILRNYIAQNAIEEAESGNFMEVRRVLELLKNPFEDSDNHEREFSLNQEVKYDSLPPSNRIVLKVS